VSLKAIAAIEAMVAPVVLITTGAILTNALLGSYSLISDHIRAMARERVGILGGEHGEHGAAGIGTISEERLGEIDVQLPMLLVHHRILRRSLLVMYLGLVLLTLSVIGIAVALLTDSEVLASVALGFVVAGTVDILVGLALVLKTLAISANEIAETVERTGAFRKR
jgi:hypothetical protein